MGPIKDKNWWLNQYGIFVEQGQTFQDQGSFVVTTRSGIGQDHVRYTASEPVWTMWEKFQQMQKVAEAVCASLD